jgi:hypothetical protein
MNVSRFDYMEVDHALAGTEKSLRNLGSLNDMGANGWEIMYVSPTDDKDIVHIIYKRLCQDITDVLKN